MLDNEKSTDIDLPTTNSANISTKIEKETYTPALEHNQATGELESNIISLFNGKMKNYAFSFTGLRRILGNIHQQSLSNSLDRLVEDSWLIKDQEGYYTLDPKKKAQELTRFYSPRIIEQPWNELWLGQPLTPAPIPVTKVYQELHGKWFGKSRFVGGAIDKQKNVAILEWMETTGKGQTQLRLGMDELRARFRNLDWQSRDKAIEVFNRACMNQNIFLIFEPASNLKNN